LKKRNRFFIKTMRIQWIKKGPFLLALLSVSLFLIACRTIHLTRVAPEEGVSRIVPEHPVVLIPLAGDLSKDFAQISGLAWYNDYLIILPQYPDRISSRSEGRILAVHKADILAFLDGRSIAPIKPREITFVAPGLRDRIKGFQGYEAIVFKGGRAFLTIEAKSEGLMSGYLVAGEIASDMRSLHLDPGTLREIPSPADLKNMCYEALVVINDKIVVLYEANGANVNPDPFAHLFDLRLGSLGIISFPTIEYRLTDATSPDPEGRFWIINPFFPGDITYLKPAPDRLTAEFGTGPTHSRSAAVERLIELWYTAEGILLTDTPPVQLELVNDGKSRNWEGIVRLDERGFLLMTDKHPDTILAFVPARHEAIRETVR
jgi:hypothetical protein